MKIRNGFVSNSSSSSFMIHIRYLSANQIDAILKNDYMDQQYNDPWYISVQDGYIIGKTIMDNYDIYEFLEKIGVNTEKVIWYE